MLKYKILNHNDEVIQIIPGPENYSDLFQDNVFKFICLITQKRISKQAEPTTNTVVLYNELGKALKTRTVASNYDIDYDDLINNGLRFNVIFTEESKLITQLINALEFYEYKIKEELTLGKLLSMTEPELLSINRIGKKSISVLKEILARYGLSLSSSLPCIHNNYYDDTFTSDYLLGFDYGEIANLTCVSTDEGTFATTSIRLALEYLIEYDYITEDTFYEGEKNGEYFQHQLKEKKNWLEWLFSLTETEFNTFLGNFNHIYILTIPVYDYKKEDRN